MNGLHHKGQLFKSALLSVDDYHRVIATGIFANRQVELIEGMIIEMAPESSEHTYFGENIAVLLGRLTAGRAWVRENKPVTLTTSEPEPDIVLVQLPRSRYRSHHPYPEDIFLLIEVSKSTLTFDRSEKKAIYAEAEIVEYWVIDINKKQLIVHRSPLNKEYQIIFTLTVQDSISPLAFPDTVIDVNRIFADFELE